MPVSNSKQSQDLPSISVKYVAFQNSDGTYNVRCNDDEDKVCDTHRVVHEGEGAFSCRCTTDDPRILFGYCNIRMGHPCRHIFAVAAFSGLKISMRSINTRFYLDQSSVDFDSVNEKAKTTMTKAIEDKKYTGVILSLKSLAQMYPPTLKKVWMLIKPSMRKQIDWDPP